MTTTASGVRMRCVVVMALAGLALAASAHAMYMRPDLEEVPVERLIANLGEKAKQKPDDAGLLFNLARTHAMAYASKAQTAKVWRGKAEQGPWFGYEPRHVPYQVAEAPGDAAAEAAKKHLATAIELHQKVLKLQPDHLGAQLGYGWLLEQAGRTKDAITQYRKTIEKAWAEEGKQQLGRLGGRYITTEAAGYLIPLLDAEKDKAEIATLRQRTEQLNRLPRPVTPIAVPLRDGLTAGDMIDSQAAVAFDADGSGLRRRWTWITPHAAWLVLDRRDAGQVGSALQMLGSASFNLFWDNGYDALAALDDDGDGRLAGAELRGLALWHDANSNGVSDPGEVRSLAHWGIVALSCRHEVGTDGVVLSPRGVTFRNGGTRPTYDVILRPQALPSQ